MGRSTKITLAQPYYEIFSSSDMVSNKEGSGFNVVSLVFKCACRFKIIHALNVSNFFCKIKIINLIVQYSMFFQLAVKIEPANEF